MCRDQVAAHNNQTNEYEASKEPKSDNGKLGQPTLNQHMYLRSSFINFVNIFNIKK